MAWSNSLEISTEQLSSPSLILISSRGLTSFFRRESGALNTIPRKANLEQPYRPGGHLVSIVDAHLFYKQIIVLD